jgi:regulator of replication initiation timing
MSNPVVEHSIDLQVAALQAEVERLKAIPMKYRRLEFNAQLQNENDELRNRIEELERENNELLADAMRYRWIKEQSDGKPFYFHAIRHKHAENLDAAIDAALAKVRKP